MPSKNKRTKSDLTFIIRKVGQEKLRLLFIEGYNDGYPDELINSDKLDTQLCEALSQYLGGGTWEIIQKFTETDYVTVRATSKIALEPM